MTPSEQTRPEPTVNPPTDQTSTSGRSADEPQSDPPPVDKANFDHAYNQPDPREYYKNLGPLGYEIPQNAVAIFEKILQSRRSGAPDADPGVLDLCCSYGVNAALMRCEVTLDELYQHYRDTSLEGVPAEKLAAVDREFYAERRRADAPRFVGFDGAENAIAYAQNVGLLDAGWAENLEVAEPSEALSASLSGIGLITVTGGIGYITERTIGRLTGLFDRDRMPWVAAFVLRTVGYDTVAAVLQDRGLTTERLAGTTFRQRRFASAHEQETALAAAHAYGLDTTGKEDDGWYHCDFYLSRPPAEIERMPLSELLQD